MSRASSGNLLSRFDELARGCDVLGLTSLTSLTYRVARGRPGRWTARSYASGKKRPDHRICGTGDTPAEAIAALLDALAAADAGKATR